MCDNPIPTRILVEGRYRNLRNRTQCLDCLPFKSSIYRLKTDSQKRSEAALKAKRYRQRCLAKGFCPTNDRKVRQRASIINLVGKCQLCPYNKLIRNLSFHHLEPKAFELSSRIFSRSLEVLLPELRKCIIVCHNCHGEIHAGLVPIQDLEAAHAYFKQRLNLLEGKTWAEFPCWKS